MSEGGSSGTLGLEGGAGGPLFPFPLCLLARMLDLTLGGLRVVVLTPTGMAVVEPRGRLGRDVGLPLLLPATLLESRK